MIADCSCLLQVHRTNNRRWSTTFVLSVTTAIVSLSHAIAVCAPRRFTGPDSSIPLCRSSSESRGGRFRKLQAAENTPGSYRYARGNPSTTFVIAYVLHGLVLAIILNCAGVVTGGTVQTRQHAEPLQNCFYINCGFVSSPHGESHSKYNTLSMSTYILTSCCGRLARSKLLALRRRSSHF